MSYCCHRCWCERQAEHPDPLPLDFKPMILCDICGNKRCPHATDHRQICTNSNEPGQLGSVFGIIDPVTDQKGN